MSTPDERRVVGPAPETADRPSADALIVPPLVHRELLRAVTRAYPREGCGVLLGEVTDGERRVTRQVSTENRWDERRDRYLVDPGTLRRLLGEEERGGPRILGFYHSHPDAPAEPSGTDREYAWPWYHYLIVPVARGRPGAGRVWELDPGRHEFVERAFRPG